jgi:hypothetical protein
MISDSWEFDIADDVEVPNNRLANQRGTIRVGFIGSLIESSE